MADQVHDVFLSYSHDDDVYPPSEGWVSHFARGLSQQLITASGKRYKVWIDHKDYRKNNDSNTILRAAQVARCFVAVVSPPYATSSFCRDEVSAFLECNPEAGIFKALKLWGPHDDDAELRNQLNQRLPASLRRGNHFSFFRRPNRQPIPLMESDGREYVDTLFELVGDIVAQLEHSRPLAQALLHSFGAPRQKEELRLELERSPFGVKSTADGPIGPAPGITLANALSDCDLVVVLVDETTTGELTSFLNQVNAQHKPCMVWLSAKSGPLTTEESTASSKAQIYEERQFPISSFRSAVLDSLVKCALERGQPGKGGGPARTGKRVTVLHYAQDRDLAARTAKQTADGVRVTLCEVGNSTNALKAAVLDASTLLVIATTADWALRLITRVDGYASAQRRLCLGFPGQPLPGWTWIGNDPVDLDLFVDD